MHKYTKEQNEWLIANRQNYTYEELTEMFNTKFNCNINWNALSHHLVDYLKIHKEEIGFKHLPINTKTTSVDNRVRVKINNAKYCKNSNWKLLHHLVWEQHYGPIPKGYRIVFLDGDSTNCDINNLRCVSHSTQTKLTCRKWYGKNKLTDVGIKCCELEEIINKV